MSALTVPRKAAVLLAMLMTIVPAACAFAQTPAPQTQQAPAENSTVGSVASATGAPIVTRGDKQYSLAAGNEILKGDVLQTGNSGGLGVTFDDETTLTLGANTQVSVDDYVYQQANTRNSAAFNVARGTLAFIAGQVAKTGDMKISTPTAALGIRGTTGVVDVPIGQGGAPGETKVKLYQDQGGTVGRIEIFDNGGARLGLLSQASTGFAVRLDQALSRSLGQPRFAAVAFQIAPAELARDRNQVRALFNVHTLGRQIINIRRGGGALPPGL
ncbi:MAG: FecR family protein, partial [Xanthobacteraceae bacterium]